MRRVAVVLMIVVSTAASAQMPEAPRPQSEPPWVATARLVGVESQVAELQRLSHGSAADRWQLLWLHQLIYERVMAASLQVDATIAQIDNEMARANEVHGLLSDRRDRTVNRANLIGILVGGGLGATSSGLQLSSVLTKPASAVGIGAGALSAGFAVAGIHAQKGRTTVFDYNSNMLAELFDRPTLEDSRYPTTVWTFLNEEPTTGPAGMTRRQQLVDTWVKVERIDAANGSDKIARVTSEPSERRLLSIDDLEDRAAMLQDLRARISFLKRDLGNLLSTLPVPINPPPAAN